MTSNGESSRGRRGWRYGAWLVTLVLGAGAAALFASGRQGKLAGLDAPSAIVIAPPEEPGERLVVRGQAIEDRFADVPLARVLRTEEQVLREVASYLTKAGLL